MHSLALLRDFDEENWPSMRVVADGLEQGLRSLPDRSFDPIRQCAKYRSVTGRLAPKNKVAKNVDRLLNRFIIYPRFTKSLARHFDFFHVCDHSYAHLVHCLPSARSGVFCHDLDAFRCILEPPSDPRPRWFRAIARRTLTGMQTASVVFYSTEAVYHQLLQHKLVEATRLVKAPYGVAPFFQTDDPTGNDNARLRAAGVPTDRPFLLHVGSCIPRKRMDVLLDVFAAARRVDQQLMLVKLGEDWKSVQKAQIDRLSLARDIVQFDPTDRTVIAACYRRAEAVVMTSEAEGFGLPVAEALACGATVLCSDIPPLREVGGDAALFAPLADVDAFAAIIHRVRSDPSTAPSSQNRQRRAAEFTWERHASIVAEAYKRLL